MADILPLRHSIEIWSLDDGKPLGYGFASPRADEPDPTGVGDVVQRWLLTRSESVWASNRRVRLQEPTDQNWQISSRGAFIQRCQEKFTGETYYVKANCKRTENVTANGVTSIGPIEVPAFLPPTLGSSGQTDVGVMPIFTPQDEVRGYVHTRHLQTGETLEAWALFASYEPPGSGKVVDLGRRLFKDSPAVGFARMMDSTKWDGACTYITCACRYYTTFPTGQG
jgi:hypothetical protein